MKKLYLFIALVAVGVAFNACKEKENGGEGGGGADDNTLKSFVLKPDSLTLAVGEEAVRLVPETTPKGAKATFTWSSSADSIATVSDKGEVSPLNAGSAVITCKSGELSATCKVTVTAWENTINFTSAFLYDYEVDSANIQYITYKDDEWGTLKCVYADMNLMIFSEGFGYQNDGYLGGTELGAIAEWPCKVMYASVDDNKKNKTFVQAMGSYKGVGWTLGGYLVQKDSVHKSVPGDVKKDDYVANIKDVIKAINEDNSNLYLDAIKKAAAAVTGSQVREFYYETDEEGNGGYYSSYIPDGLVKYGSYIYTEGNPTKSSEYMMSLDFTDMAVDYFRNDASHLGGIEIEMLEDSTYKVVSDEIKFLNTIRYTQGTDPRNSKVSKKAGYIMVPDKNDPKWNKMRNEIDRFRLSLKTK